MYKRRETGAEIFTEIGRHTHAVGQVPVFFQWRKCCERSKSHAKNSASMITPLTEFPPPFMYLEEECTTRSAPSSIGLTRYGVTVVLSTTSGIPPRVCKSCHLPDIHYCRRGISDPGIGEFRFTPHKHTLMIFRSLILKRSRLRDLRDRRAVRIRCDGTAM